MAVRAVATRCRTAPNLLGFGGPVNDAIGML
jgi:hypothetical protein